MIEDGVPEALAEAQTYGVLPALSITYVESIEGAAKRGPTRCASLTTAAMLDRFAAEALAYVGSEPTVLVGHSLGAIAALHIASTTSLARDVVLLSAALWWPGDDGQLSGRQVMDEVLARADVRVWMTAGDQEEPKLLRSNDVLASRLTDAGRAPERHSHGGGHEVRLDDIVRGISRLLNNRTL